jgi:hypothetical protein
MTGKSVKIENWKMAMERKRKDKEGRKGDREKAKNGAHCAFRERGAGIRKRKLRKRKDAKMEEE